MSYERVGRGNSNWRGGMVSHPLYERYRDMIYRCSRPDHKSYKNYGGRGIRVCQEWVEDFWQFVADVGDPPPGLSLDRIDNNGDYEPGNVRWADRSTQAKNSRPRWTHRRRNAQGQFA